MSGKAKLALATAVVSATVGYLAYLGVSSSWQYYLLVDECVARADKLRDKRLRVSGLVTAGSLTIAADRRAAEFRLEGKQHRLLASCRGPIPANLAEGMEVVVEGRLEGDDRLHGEKLITRCASKYAPAAPPPPPANGGQGASKS
jgi:cytochrome c-type biogenesis protein CcmE